MGTYEFIFSTTQWITILVIICSGVAAFFVNIGSLRKENTVIKEELRKESTAIKEELSKEIAMTNSRVDLMEAELKVFKATMIELRRENNRIREDYNRSMEDYMKLNALQHDDMITNQKEQGKILGVVRDSILEHLAAEKAIVAEATKVKNKKA
jgi:hypothetical protein